MLTALTYYHINKKENATFQEVRELFDVLGD